MQLGRRWRAIAIVGATLVLTLAVAFASRPVQIVPGGAGDSSVTHVLGDVGLYLLLVVLAVMLAVTIWALWPDGVKREIRPRRWWEHLIPYLSLAIVFGLLSFLVANPRALRRLRQSSLGQMLAGLRDSRPRGRIPSGATTQAGPDWAAIAIVAVIVVGAAALLFWRWQVARRRLPTPRELALDLEEVLDQGLAQLAPETAEPLDPREAVIAAWAGFERVLARGGVLVRAGEAPHEYLSRALIEVSLPLDAVALRSFTDLFEWARYSTNPVTEVMREQAVATLRAVRDSVHDHAAPDVQMVPA
ncbi:MAG: DUF4129 domain-containing protein [Candidatus Dormibacteraeota bacterium]|nr:DUF4129 domain-containing protein [Candidatus Dormibacteraeota bacterium]